MIKILTISGLLIIAMSFLSSPSAARDSVGDLNAHYIEPGDFAGSYKVMGKSDIPVSIAIGGFVKAVGIMDTQSEREDTYFRPSLLLDTDTDGNTHINANFTRWYIDGRADLLGEHSHVRGYLETDFYASSYRLRHAFLSWQHNAFTLTAGQTWTTFMDVTAFPEMIYELAPSGGILVRQGQFRLTHKVNETMSYSIALEDPNGEDIETQNTYKPINNSPDLTANIRFQPTDGYYIQLSALLRDLSIKDTSTNNTSSSMSYGTHISGAWTFTNNDKLAISFLYGDGIGHYLIGASQRPGGNAGYMNGQKLKTRKAMGGYISYKHFWNMHWRSSLITGLSDQDEVSFAMTNDHFEHAMFISANLFWHPNKVINTGLELTYGEADFALQSGDSEKRDNARLSFVIQLF